jgi:hypothetical protein
MLLEVMAPWLDQSPASTIILMSLVGLNPHPIVHTDMAMTPLNLSPLLSALHLELHLHHLQEPPLSIWSPQVSYRLLEGARDEHHPVHRYLPRLG